MAFSNRIIKNEDLTVHNDGIQVRSWCHVRDFVDCIELILQNKKAIGEIFNVGNPKATCTILALAETMIRVSGSTSKIHFEKLSYPDVMTRVPVMEMAREILGFEPKIL